MTDEDQDFVIEVLTAASGSSGAARILSM